MKHDNDFAKIYDEKLAYHLKGIDMTRVDKDKVAEAMDAFNDWSNEVIQATNILNGEELKYMDADSKAFTEALHAIDDLTI